MSSEPKYIETGSRSNAAKISFLATGLAILVSKYLNALVQGDEGEVRDEDQNGKVN